MHPFFLKTTRKLYHLPRRPSGYSGDDITNICRDAALNGMRRGIAGKTPAELMKMKELGQVRTHGRTRELLVRSSIIKL